MAIPELGTLERIDAREVWKHEALEFTPWLRANIEQLGLALGLDLEVEAEVAVGAFSVDLAGRELGSNRPLIVENQLEQTDHSHLGQLLTYAAGLEAAVAVWIAPRVRDEHRQALDWLNSHTVEGLDFFGVEVELLRIGDSRPAANFRVVAQPNEWAKVTRQAGTTKASSERALRYQAFFGKVLPEFKRRRPGSTNANRVPLENWLTFSAGRTGFGFSWSFPAGSRIACELYIDTGNNASTKQAFDALEARRTEIESGIGTPIEWERLDNRRASRLAVRRQVPEDPPFDENVELQEWAVATMTQMYDVLKPIVKNL